MLSFDLVTDEEDILYESKILESPDSLNLWLDYYKYKEQLYTHVKDRQLNIKQRLFILKRACGHFARSYKFWSLYLDLRISLVKNLNPISQRKHFLSINQLFEQCLKYLDKFPMIWLKYLRFLTKYQYNNLILVRKVFNRALISLPLTQHELVWEIYFSDFIDSVLLENFKETDKQDLAPVISNAYLRYLKFNSSGRAEDNKSVETFIGKLQILQDYKTIIKIYETYILSESKDNKVSKFISSMGKSSFEVYLDYCDYLAEYAQHLETPRIVDDKVNKFMEQLLQKFPDQNGLIVVKHATYYIKTKNFTKAIDVFEGNLNECITIKDFNLIYDAYSEFQESYILSLMNEQQGDYDDETKDNILDLQMNKLEDLLAKRKLMILDILLRQDSNNCCTWLKKIHEINDLRTKLKCFATAAQKIDVSKAHFYDYDTNATFPESNINNKEENENNKDSESNLNEQLAKRMQDEANKTTGLSQIWIEYAQVYAANGDIETAINIYKTAVKVPFMNTNDLVDIYISWAELMISEDQEDIAIKIIEDGLVKPDFKLININEEDVHVSDTRKYKAQLKIFKSLKLWSFYLDLIESTNDIERTIQSYDAFLGSSGAVTPLIVVNYCDFLQNNQYFSKMFQVFETAISKFRNWEVKIELYLIYLKALIKRYRDIIDDDQKESFIMKERISDTFESAIEGCPVFSVNELYSMYINFEQLGLGKTKSVNKILLLHKTEILHLHFDDSLLNSDMTFSKLSRMNLRSTESLDKLRAQKQQKPEDRKNRVKLLVNAYQLFIDYVQKFTDSNSLQAFTAEELRTIYENVVNYEPGLPKIEKVKFGIEWIFEVELKLKQIERCRQIFKFCGQDLLGKFTSDHDNLQDFWDRWELFELDYGNEDTFKEMLKIKRGDQV